MGAREAPFSGQPHIPRSSNTPLIDDATLWPPISVEELSKNLPHLFSAVGPDGLTARKFV